MDAIKMLSPLDYPKDVTNACLLYTSQTYNIEQEHVIQHIT